MCRSIAHPNRLWQSAALAVLFGLASGCGYAGIAVAIVLATSDDSGGSGRQTGDVRVVAPARSTDPEVELTVTVAQGTRELLFELDNPGPATLIATGLGRIEEPGHIVDIEARTGERTFSVTWDSGADFNDQPRVGVVMTITPIGPSGEGRSTDTAPMTVGDSPPVLEILEPVPDQILSGNAVVRFVATDNESDPFDVELTFEGGTPLQLAVPDPTSDLPTLPEDDGGEIHTYIWASNDDFFGEKVESITITLAPDDDNPATDEAPVEVTIDLDNNSRPVVTLSELSLNPDRVSNTIVEFTTIDPESHAVDVLLQWANEGDTFPELPVGIEQPAFREALLTSPLQANQRKALQLLSPGRAPIEGRVERVSPGLDPTPPADEIQVGDFLVQGFLYPELVGKTIELYRPKGLQVLASGLANPGPVAIEPDGDTVLVGLDDGSGRLVRLDLRDGGQLDVVAQSLGTPIALDLLPGGMDALIIDGSGDRLLQVDLGASMGSPEVIAGLTDPSAVAALSPLQALVIADGELLLVNLLDGTSLELLENLANPRGLVAHPVGGKAYLVEDFTGASGTEQRLLELDLVTLDLRILTTSEDGGPPMGAHLALSHKGNRLYVATDEGGTDRVFQLDVPTGVAGERAALLDGASGLAVSPNGALLVSEAGTGQLLVGGGVEQTRAILAVNQQPPRLRLDTPFSPAPALGQAFCIPFGRTDGMLSLSSNPEGLTHRFAWATDEDNLPQRTVRVRASCFDASEGVSATVQAGKTFDRFEELPVVLADIPSAEPGTIVDGAFADVSGDGFVDALALVDEGDGNAQVFILVSHGPGQLLEPASEAFSLHSASLPSVLEGTNFLSYKTMSLGDTNGDGRVDIACGFQSRNNQGGVVILEQVPPQANPVEFVTGAIVSPEDSSVLDVVDLLHLVDIDHDRDLDLVAGSTGTDDLYLFLQQSGTFGQDNAGLEAPDLTLEIDSVFGLKDLAVDDMTADGRRDLVAMGNQGARGLLLFEQAAGTPLFGPLPTDTIFPDNGGLFGLELYDLDADGFTDIILRYNSPDRIRFLLQQSEGGFDLSARPPVPLDIITPAGLSLVASAAGGIQDLNCDGRPDVVLETKGPGFHVHYQRADGGSGVDFLSLPDVAVPAPGLGNFVRLAITDADLDGDLDILSMRQGDQSVGPPMIALLRQVGSESAHFLTEPTADLSNGVNVADFSFTPNVVAADMDGDRDLDVVVPGPEASLIFEQSLAGRFAEQVEVELPYGSLPMDVEAAVVAVGDLDGRYGVDIVAGIKDSAGTAILVFATQADGTLPQEPTLELDVGLVEEVTRVAVGDLDGDGLLEVVVVHAIPNAISIFRQLAPLDFDGDPGASGVNPLQTIALDGPPGNVLLSDVEPDGDLDLVVVGRDAIVVFIQETELGFIPMELEPPVGFFLTDGVALTDIDDDGDRDVVGVAVSLTIIPPGQLEVDIRLAFYRQTSTGVFEETAGPDIELVLFDFPLPQPVCLATGDIDGDGDEDIVVGMRGRTQQPDPWYLYRRLAPGQFATPFLLRPDDADLKTVGFLRLVDLDGDGSLEALSINSGSNNVTVLSPTSPDP